MKKEIDPRIKELGLNRVWLADFTTIPRIGGTCSLAIVMDACSRKILAWQIARRKSIKLACSTLEIALASRQPKKDCIHRSPKKSQYTSAEYLKLLAKNHLTPAYGVKGEYAGNAVLRSFFATLKGETDVMYFRFEQVVIKEILDDYITYFNEKRKHSSIGWQSPLAFETQLKQSNP